MNERIKELLEQAGYTKAHHDEYGRLTVMPEFNREKFAELIVRECAKFLEANSGYDQSNNAWHPEPEDLLEHFGVEE